MNLSKADDLDDEKPKTTYKPTHKRDQSQNCGSLRVGHHPESGLKAVSSCFDNKEQQMKNAACRKYSYGYKKGRNDHDT